MGCSKKNREIFPQSFLNKFINKSKLKFNLGLALTGLWTTRLRTAWPIPVIADSSFHFTVPNVGPNITRAFNTSSTSLFVSWINSIPPESYVGVLTGYRVIWSEQPGSKNKRLRDLGLDAVNFTITGLKAYGLYKVKVAGRTNGGSGTSNDRYVRTDEDGEQFC